MLDFLKGLDVDLFLFLNKLNNSFFDFLFFWISDKWIWIPFYFYLLMVVYRFDKNNFLWIMVFVALTITISDQISSNVIKENVLRLRPCHNPEIAYKVHLVNNYCGGTYGFVSSHAANVFGLATFLSFLFKGQYSMLIRVLWIWAFMVSYSRIYLGVHYPADVAGGAIVGIFAGIFCVKIYLKVIHKHPTLKRIKN